MSRTFEFPGFVDVHVHFRDPGLAAAETTASGAEAARRGGFAAVVTMPNTTPAGDSVAWVRGQLDAEGLPVRIIPSACITKGRLGRQPLRVELSADPFRAVSCRLGVGHRHHRRETAAPGGLGPARRRFGGRESRIAEMDVNIDESGKFKRPGHKGKLLSQRLMAMFLASIAWRMFSLAICMESYLSVSVFASRSQR